MADKALDLLRALGDTPDEIAAFLEGQGFKGVQYQPHNCPVSNYMKEAGFTGVVTTWGGNFFSHEETCVQYRPAGRFAQAFDQGKYPQLIKRRIKK